MSSLYQITTDIDNFQWEWDEATGEPTPECWNKYQELMSALDNKEEAYALVYKNLMADYEALDKESKIMKNRAEIKKKQAERIKNTLSQVLNGNSLETSKVKVSFRKSKSIEVEDEAAFTSWALESGNNNLIKLKTTSSIDKNAVKEAISNGQEVKFAQLVEKKNIQIK